MITRTQAALLQQATTTVVFWLSRQLGVLCTGFFIPTSSNGSGHCSQPFVINRFWDRRESGVNMAKHAQQILFLVAFAVLSSYLASDMVSGVTLKLAEDNYEIDDSPRPPSVEGNKNWTENGESIELFPVSEPHLELFRFKNSRRKLGDFMSCSVCVCCDSTRTTCYKLPCCFTINCNVQPYGFCRFVPVSCYCQGCT